MRLRRLARHTMPALLLAAALAVLGCTGGSDRAATTATASLSATPTATAVPRPSATATAVPTGTTTTTRTLTTSATGSGRISPLPDTYSYLSGDSVTVTATPDEGWRLASWGGDCSGTGTTCVLTMDANKTVTAAFTELPATRCATPAAADCIRAVYLGAPDDYAQVADIPAGRLLTSGSDGRYVVERGQQVTVVTAAQLPAGWTRFYLERGTGPTFGVPSPVSFSQLIKPVGTTYTFTVTDDERGASFIEFDLTAAKPHPARPNHKPQLGDVVVTTQFLVPTLRYNRLDTTGVATAPGSYAFLRTAGDVTSAIDNFGNLPTWGVELRVNATDASGTSRASFYNVVSVGDTFDYQTGRDECGFRFRVTGVDSTKTPRIFGIAHTADYSSGECVDVVDDASAARDVSFEWRVPPGAPATNGIRALLPGEPVGQGTYRLERRAQYVIDVPAGTRVALASMITGYETNTRAVDLVVILQEVDTESLLFIDWDTGEELDRFISPSLGPAATVAVNGSFDHLIASIRLADQDLR